jgi:replicative DNA helicase
MAGTNVGKSLAMCHMASAMLAQGKNVLYITMEMAEERIAERLDANLFDVQLDQLGALSKDIFDTKIRRISEKTKGKLIVKEYPTASAHVGHFRALLNELKMKKNFIPDVIFIDYLNICASSRMKGLGGAINSYSFVKAIAEELRGLAVEFNVPIWSATQVNRTGFSSSDIELTDTSESFGLPATADFMVALISTEQLEKAGQLMVKQLKNRYSDVAKNKRFIIGVDKSKMRLFDVEASAQSLSDANQTSPVTTSPFGSRSAGPKKSFEGFKV